MSKRSIWPGAVVLALAANALVPNFARSQSVWLPRDVDRAVKIELLKPELDYGPAPNREDFATGAVVVSARLPLGSKLSFISQLPYARYRGTETYGRADRALGDLYLGLEGHGALFGEFGVYLPTSSENAPYALETGLYADLGRWEAYYDNAISLQAALHLHYVAASRLMVGMRVSPALAIPTFGGVDPELFGNYSGRAGYEGHLLRIGAGVTGRVLVTAGGGLTLGERTLHQVELHGDAGTGMLRPGVDLIFPLGDFGRNSPVVLGANLSFVL